MRDNVYEVILCLTNYDMEVDKKMGIDVYEQIPVMESEKFLLREIEDGDAEDLFIHINTHLLINLHIVIC